MKILFVGDVVGKGGRKVLKEKISQIQQDHDIEFTIVNVENAAGGFGVTGSIAEDILALGADVLTSGNHIWDRKESYSYLERQPRLLRPGNYPSGLPGHYLFCGESKSGVPVCVVNLQGRVFMPIIDCPFRFIDRQLNHIREKSAICIIDFHAEATSEKMAFGWYVDDKVSAVLGTHTHVPTADHRILPGGTAYVTDVGMTGSYDSVIGMKTENSLYRFLTGLNARFEPETKNPRLSSVILDIDENDGKAKSIQRCDMGLEDF
jgi:metallophosphoesterase (TIGR00282 family)